jgi:hypothetical protein
MEEANGVEEKKAGLGERAAETPDSIQQAVDALVPLLSRRSEVRRFIWGILKGSDSVALNSLDIDPVEPRLLRRAALRASNALRPVFNGRRHRRGPLSALVRKATIHNADGTRLGLKYEPTPLGDAVVEALEAELERQNIPIPELPGAKAARTRRS